MAVIIPICNVLNLSANIRNGLNAIFKYIINAAKIPILAVSSKTILLPYQSINAIETAKTISTNGKKIEKYKTDLSFAL